MGGNVYYIDETNTKQHTYPTYGRQFASYKWYKPIIAGVVFLIVYMCIYLGSFIGVGILYGVAAGDMDPLDTMLSSMTTSYDDMKVTGAMDNLMNLGPLALMIPALWLTALIVRDRPFSSYSSARGGWSSRVFWRVFPVAFLCAGVPILVEELLLNHGYRNFSMNFTIAGLVALTVLGPLQCVAEEYLFRGFLMQTLGSWLRIPVLAVVVQAVLFAAGHPYNRLGQIAIVISGLTFGLAAWITRGLEASSAIHIANNMTIFYLMGFHMTTLSSEQDMSTIYMDLIRGAVFIAILFLLKKKTRWFDKVRKDDLAKFNARVAEKRARKEAKKAAKLAKKGITYAGNAAAGAVNGAIDFVSGNEGSGAQNAESENPMQAAESAEKIPEFEYSGRVHRSSEEGGKHYKK